MKRALIIGDNLETLKPQWDTSLYFARSLQRSHWRVSWTTSRDLIWKGHELEGEAQELAAFVRGELPQIQKTSLQKILSFDLIVIRKDPPFDDSYLRLVWMLAPFEKKVRMFNLPSLLTRYHEKLLPWEGLHQGFLNEDDLLPILMAERSDLAQGFLAEQGVQNYVTKPWLGYQGHEVFKLDATATKSFKWESLEDFRIMQPLVENIEEVGDRRAFFSQGQYLGSFVRIPAKGSIVSNIARGGTAVDRALTKAEQKLIWKVEKFLQAIHIDLAGADIIDGKLNEINITSPTGLGVYENLFGEDLSDKILRAIV